MAQELNTVSVIGNGIIGHGIAEVFASAGVNTILIGRSEESLAQAIARIGTSLEEFARRGLLRDEKPLAVLKRTGPTIAWRARTVLSDL